MKNLFLTFVLVFTFLKPAFIFSQNNTVFSWVKISENQYAILDNGKSIAKLNIATNWVYFNDVYKNSSSRFIAMDQGMSPLSISWPALKKYKIMVDSISFKQPAKDKISVEFEMHLVFKNGKFGNNAIKNFSKLAISFDPESKFYKYSISSKLEIPRKISDEFFAENLSLEYQDVLPDGIVEFMPPKSKKWQWLIYGKNDEWFKFPLNHHNIYNELPIKTDNRLFFAYENDKDTGNPTFTLDKQTAIETYFILCTWAYDLHFFYEIKDAIKKVRNGQPIEVNYSICYEDSEEIKNNYQNARISPVVETQKFKVPEYPFNHFSTFEPSEEYKTPNDHYFWYSGDDWENCSWDITQGFNSKGSLKIKNDLNRTISWKYLALSPSYIPPIQLRGRYKISAMVKTRNLNGSVKIGWQTASLSGNGIYFPKPLEASLPYTGQETDWTPIFLETKDVNGSYSASIQLILEGTGEAWFDNVKLESLGGGISENNVNQTPDLRPGLNPAQAFLERIHQDEKVNYSARKASCGTLPENGYGIQIRARQLAVVGNT